MNCNVFYNEKLIVCKHCLQKTNFSVLLHFSVALAQNTTGVTTATTMAAAGRNGPLAPHMRPCAPTDALNGWETTPRDSGCSFGRGMRVCMPLKALLCSGNDALPQHWSFLRAIHTLNSLKNYTRLLGGLSPIHSTHWCGAKGLMRGTRGPYPLAAAMVGNGCVGQCWQLEAKVRLTYCRNSSNCLQKYFFIPI
jgi:hypothetical protein